MPDNSLAAPAADQFSLPDPRYGQFKALDSPPVPGACDRPNISLDVVRHHDDKDRREFVVRQVAGLVGGGPGLLYAATCKDTEKYAAKLAAEGLRTAACHPDLPAAERERLDGQFRDGALDVLVATSGIAVGVDNPGIRFVVHAHLPESLDAYCQEIGSAGRDGDEAAAVLHHSTGDPAPRTSSNSPDPGQLHKVLKLLKDAGGPTPASSLAELAGIPVHRVTGLVAHLEEADCVTIGKRGVRLASKAKLPAQVAAAVELAEARQRVEQSRLTMMRGYAEADGCRRQFLLTYFGEDRPAPCHNCDSCAEAAHRAEAPAGRSGKPRGKKGKKHDGGRPGSSARPARGNHHLRNPA